jgi:hypothetical protein
LFHIGGKGRSKSNKKEAKESLNLSSDESAELPVHIKDKKKKMDYGMFSDSEEDSVIGEKPNTHTVRKIRDVQVDTDGIVKFTCSWVGYDRTADQKEPIEVVMESVNESIKLSKSFSCQHDLSLFFEH